MSLIYKSIKKAQKEKVKTSLSPQEIFRKQDKKIGVVPKSSRLIGRFFFYVLVMSIVLFSAYIIAKRVLTDVEEPRSVVAQKNKENKKEENITSSAKDKASNTNTTNSTSTKVNSATPKTIEGSFRELYPPVKRIKKSLPRKLDYTKEYVIELRQHFTRQIQKNNRIFFLQNQLKTAYIRRDRKKFFALLKKTEKLLGKKSVFGIKWEAVWELRDKHYDRASELFRRVLSLNPEDKESRINLIYALIGAKRYSEAKRELLKLKSFFPDDLRVIEMENKFLPILGSEKG